MKTVLTILATLACAPAFADVRYVQPVQVEGKASGCICDDCKCKPGVCPGGCPVAGKPLTASVFTVKVSVAGQAGTGTCIAAEDGRSLILTNAHVVEDRHANQPIKATHYDPGSGQWYSYRCKYVAGSRVRHLGFRNGVEEIAVDGPDLCLLVTDDGELPACEIADQLPSPGSPVQQFGFGGRYGIPEPFHPLHKVGAVAYHTADETCCTFRSQSGDSGSGVFDAAGRLVAVTCGLDGEESNPRSINRAVSLVTVHSFTVTTLERKGIFARLKNRLAARKINTAVKGYLRPDTTPLPAAPKASAPKASTGHWEKQCQGNGTCRLVWVKD